MKHLILFILLSTACYSKSSSLSPSGKIKVTVTTFRNNNGYACFALFNKADGFPSFENKAMKTAYVKINNKSAETAFENLPEGDYAIAVYHDANGNKEVDKNFLGIPKEGLGCSNNPKGGFGPPDFDDAKFKFSGNTQTITINIRYL